MRESDEPLTDTLVRCLADPTDLKALERLENDGDQAGARLMRARLADQAAVRLDAALEDNRARVRRQLGRDWAWATDEVMSDLTIRTIRRLDYWHRTNTDRAEGGGDEPGRVRQPAHRHRGRRMVQNPTAQTPHGHDPDPGTARGKAETAHGPGRPDGVGTVAPARADPRRLRRDLRRIRHLRGTRRRRREPGSPAAGDRESYRQWDGDTADAPLPVSAGYKTDMEALALAVQAEWGLAAWKRILTRCMTSNRARPCSGRSATGSKPTTTGPPETGPLPLPQGMRRHRRP